MIEYFLPSIEIATRFAVDPIAVTLPPKHAPNRSAHQSGDSSGASPTIRLTIGMKVETNTMLSTNAEPTAVIATMSGVRTNFARAGSMPPGAISSRTSRPRALTFRCLTGSA